MYIIYYIYYMMIPARGPQTKFKAILEAILAMQSLQFAIGSWALVALGTVGTQADDGKSCITGAILYSNIRCVTLTMTKGEPLHMCSWVRRSQGLVRTLVPTQRHI